MDLRQLEMFLAVADLASFTVAGHELHVAQSAISRKIRLLEHELGEPLFKRVNKRVHLTPDGETLARYARRVFLDLRNAAIEVSELAHLNRGRVRIGAGMTACIHLLPPILEKFKALYPNVEPDVVTGPTESLLSQIRNNQLDIGVFTLPIQYPDLDVIPFCSEEMVVVTSPKHPQLARRRSLPAAEIAQYPLILFSKGATTRILIDRFFHEAGIVPRISMESESVATIKPLVAVNLGITIIPLRAVQAEAARGELHYLRIRDHSFKREIGLVFQKCDQQPRVVGELIRLFRAAA